MVEYELLTVLQPQAKYLLGRPSAASVQAEKGSDNREPISSTQEEEGLDDAQVRCQPCLLQEWFCGCACA